MYVNRMRPQEFAAVYAVLEQSFPIDEYRPFAEQQVLFADERYAVYVLRDEADTVCGMLALWAFPSFDFIEHFATLPTVRGKGYGSQMLQEILRKRGRPACLEVEPPVDEITARRVRFYERQGFYLSDFPYMQPAISKGRQPVPLQIMTTQGMLEKATFESIRDVLYTEVYHVKA